MNFRGFGRNLVSLTAAGLLCLVTLPSATAGPLDRLDFQSVVPTQSALYSVAYGGGKFVAVGRGTILASKDGVSWSSASSGTALTLSTVVYGAGSFVIAASDTYVFHSTDGEHWTRHSLGSLGGKLLLTYGGGQFLAIRADGRTAVSSNGVDWVSSDGVVAGRNLAAVAYGNGRFVALGTSYWVSTDGLNWTSRPADSSASFTTLAFGNGLFVTYSYGQIWTSNDGESWTRHSGTRYVQTLNFLHGQFVALSSDGVWLSTDGVVWEQVNGRNGLGGGGIAYGAGRYVLVDIFSGLLVSPDAVHWSSVGGGSSNLFRSVAYGRGRFIAVGNLWLLGVSQTIRAPVLRSEDGVVWDAADSGTQAELTGSAYGDGRFVVVGPGVGTGGSGIGVSEDGENWEALALNLPLTTVAHRPGQFIAVGGQGASAVSPDGVHWTRLETGTTNQLNGVCGTQETVIAVGNKGTLLRIGEGLTWTSVASGTKADLQSVAIGHDVMVAVGASVILRSTDGGLTWKPQVGLLPILRRVVFGNELFVAVGDQGTILLSTDGTQWIHKRVTGGPSLTTGAWGNGQFMLAGSLALLRGNLRPGILSDPMPGPTGLRFTVTGEVGRVYRVQMSERLVSLDWSDLGSVTSLQLSMPFTDPNAGATSSRFYRVISDE